MSCGAVTRVAVAALAIAVLNGCAKGEQVVRVIDGRPVAGEFVPADAYAAYLRASIADAAGDLPAAIEGYMIAVALGPRDPEPWARLGDARCRREAKDPKSDEAIAHALSIDAAYAPALEARARCAERRGDVKLAIESAERAAKADAAAVEPLATLARLEGPVDPSSEELRARLLAITLVEGTNTAAWDALATWARGHGDAVLEARALGRVAQLGAEHQAEIDAAAVRLAGGGELGAARSLARARVGSSALAQAGQIDPRVARLAMDGALVSGDLDEAERVATRSHVEGVVVAARSLLLGSSETARALATPLADADPRALAPRLVLAAAGEGKTGVHAASGGGGVGASSAPVPAEVWLAYGRAIAREGSTDAARAFLRAIPREKIVEGDSLTTPLAVALAATGVIETSELDANGRIELAERRAEPASDDAIAAADPRHRLLALARRAPGDPGTLALAHTLAPLRSRDAIVAVAFARLALAGAGDTLSVGKTLARLDPSDPLVAAAVLDCALRSGDTRAIPLAKARLAAVAHTPAERARVVE